MDAAISTQCRLIIAELRRPKGLPSGDPYSYRKEKETCELTFSWLSWPAVYGDYKTQNRESNSKQKTSLQSYKTQINILPFPGLAESGTEQPG